MISLPRAILFSLAVFGDVVRILPQNKKQAWNFWFGDYRPMDRFFNRQSFTNTVSRLLVTQQIEKQVKNGRVKIKITPKGLKRLSLELDLEKFSRKKWDKKWRVVIFDVAEKRRKKRDYLREKLKSLGFGMLQESVWISPFPIENELIELFQTLNFKGEILVSRSEILVGDQKMIARNVWRLASINEEYKKLVVWWQRLPQERKNKAAASVFQRRYFGILWTDPFLPRELLPADWPADEVEKLYLKKVAKVLNRLN